MCNTQGKVEKYAELDKISHHWSASLKVILNLFYRISQNKLA